VGKISLPPGFDPRTVHAFVSFYHQFIDVCGNYNGVLRTIFRHERDRGSKELAENTHRGTLALEFMAKYNAGVEIKK
jgi:hypothetical protein